MKWADVNSTVTKKLSGTIKRGAKHDIGYVSCNGVFVGHVSLGRHGEMKNREIGNCARSLRINEHRFKDLVRCTLSAENFCEMVTETI